jgi:hypothetical protein
MKQPTAASSDENQDEGHKRSLKWFMQFITAEKGEAKAQWLWKQMGILCVRTILAVMPTLSREYDQHFKSFGNIPVDLTDLTSEIGKYSTNTSSSTNTNANNSENKSSNSNSNSSNNISNKKEHSKEGSESSDEDDEEEKNSSSKGGRSSGDAADKDTAKDTDKKDEPKMRGSRYDYNEDDHDKNETYFAEANYKIFV